MLIEQVTDEASLKLKCTSFDVWKSAAAVDGESMSIQSGLGAGSFPPLELLTTRQFRKGAKETLEYHIGCGPDGTAWEVSILVVKGTEKGPTLLVSGGTHGDEFEGPLAIQILFQQLNPEELRGTWFGLPVLNAPAMSACSRCSPFDQQDLARTFPGKEEGSLTEQIAYRFGHFVFPRANYYIDLHSAGACAKMVSLCGYGTVPNAQLLSQQRGMAIAFDADLTWGTPPNPGRTLSQANALGIPSIYAETTGTGGARNLDVQHFCVGVLNVLRFAGMLGGPFRTQPRGRFRETFASTHHEGFLQVDHPSPANGLFKTSVALWSYVEKDQALGTLIDASGRIVASVSARRSGHIIYLRHWVSVKKGDPLVVIVEGLEQD